MKVKEVYSGVYASVKKWPSLPEEHTITGVEIEHDNMSNDKEARVIVLFFDKQPVKYRLNKTNANSLVEAWGDEMNDWLGKKVTIHRVQAQIRGQAGWAGIVTPVKGKTARK